MTNNNQEILSQDRICYNCKHSTAKILLYECLHSSQYGKAVKKTDRCQFFEVEELYHLKKELIMGVGKRLQRMLGMF